MDSNSKTPAPPATTMTTLANRAPRPAMQGSSRQQTVSVTAVPWSPTAVGFLSLRPPVQEHHQTKISVFRPTLANPSLRPTAPGSSRQQMAAVTAVPWSPTAVEFHSLRPPVHQHGKPKLPISRPPAPATFTPARQLLQGTSNQQVAAAAAAVAAIAPHGPAVLGVGRPLAPPTATMANPSPRFMQVDNILTIRHLQCLPKLPFYSGPTPRPELARSISSGIAQMQSSLELGPCILNMQADLPSPDELSEMDSGSEDELEILA